MDELAFLDELVTETLEEINAARMLLLDLNRKLSRRLGRLDISGTERTGRKRELVDYGNSVHGRVKRAVKELEL